MPSFDGLNLEGIEFGGKLKLQTKAALYIKIANEH